MSRAPHTLPTRREVAQAYAAVHRSLRAISLEALAEQSDTSKDHQSRLQHAQRCPSLWVFIKTAIANDVDPVLVMSMVMRRLRGES
jgi:hypothetical protein